MNNKSKPEYFSDFPTIDDILEYQIFPGNSFYVKIRYFGDDFFHDIKVSSPDRISPFSHKDKPSSHIISESIRIQVKNDFPTDSPKP